MGLFMSNREMFWDILSWRRKSYGARNLVVEEQTWSSPILSLDKKGQLKQQRPSLVHKTSKTLGGWEK